MSTHKKGQTVRSEARTMVKRIAKKCEEEALQCKLLFPLHKPNLRTAEYTGLSITSVSRIKHECSNSGEEVLPTPGRRRPKCLEYKFHCSEEDKTIIRNIIYSFYVEKKIMPSGSKLLAAIREEINFPWEISTLYKLLKAMGYKWKKCNSIRRILLERQDLVTWRGKYLKRLHYYRMENKDIIFINETWVDINLSFGKCWQNEEELGTLKNTSLSDRLIIVHAGGKNGFVPNAGLIFKANSTSGDYYGQMNATKFRKWILEKLLPNISSNTVVVMDNAPYHCVVLNKPPGKYASKADMINWLMENNIPHAATMNKYELVELIARYKMFEKTYVIDEVLKMHGCIALRLPPYMHELNPFELVWAQLKRNISEKNTLMLTFAELESTTQEAIDSITPTEWENFCTHTEEIEKKYRDKDNLLETAIDDLSLNIHDTDTEEDQNDSSSSEDL